MKAWSSTSRSMLIAVVVVSMLLCQVGTASLVGPGSPEGAAAQIEFTPHLATLVVTGAPPVTAVSTLAWVPTVTPPIGPVREVASGEDLPPIYGEELLEEPFGYARVKGRPGEYLVWWTDDDGDVKYYITTESNPLLADIKRISDARQAAEDDKNAHNEDLKTWGGWLISAASAGVGLACLFVALLPGGRGTSPLTGDLGNCVKIAFGAAGASAPVGASGTSGLLGYERRNESLRRQLESVFSELSDSASP